MIKILVVEDEQCVAELLRRGLEESGYRVELIYDRVWRSHLFRAGELQVVVPDVIPPKVGNFELCKGIRNTGSRIPAPMPTTLGTTDNKFDGFDAGADDYMMKPFDFRELNARIKVSLKRRPPGISETRLTELVYADLHINRQTKTVYRQEGEIKLSPKEYNLLLYVAGNPKRLLARVGIVDKVWSTHFDTGTNFIDTHINYLCKKVGRDYGVKLIHTKPGMGFIFRQEL